MGRKAKTVSEKDAREIAEYLLKKGVSQARIAVTVDKSQAWVSGISRKINAVSDTK